MSTPKRSPRESGAGLAFTSTEAACYLGVSVGTVRRWSIPNGGRTPGGRRRFSRSELDMFVAMLHPPEGDHESPPAA